MEYLIGFILPGRPIAVVLFKVYGYVSVQNAIGFLGDLKLGTYMKIPPRSMFAAQVTNTCTHYIPEVSFSGRWKLDVCVNVDSVNVGLASNK